MPEISIVLPAYNGEKYLRESVDSVIAQTFGNWELIIVDDCSSDSTPRISEEYAAKDSRIRVIHNAINQKLPRSLNIGFAEAEGRYLTWTSDDNAYLPEALEEMYGFMENNPQVPLVTADMDAMDENGNFLMKWGAFSNERMIFSNCVGACFLYKSEVPAEIGGYSEDMFLAEDYEYWLRIMLKYGDLSRIGKTLYKYRYHSESLSVRDNGAKRANLKMHKFKVENLERLIEVTHPNSELLCCLYLLLLDTAPVSENILKKITDTVSLLGMDEPSDSRPAIIYGAGEMGDKAFRLLGSRAVYYADRDLSKHGKLKNGLEIISPEEMCGMTDKYQIAAAVSIDKMYGVLNSLNEMGIKKCVTLQRLVSENRYSEGC